MARLLQHLLASATAFLMLQYFFSQSRAQEPSREAMMDDDACTLGQVYDYDNNDDAWVLGMPQPGESRYAEFLLRYDGWHPELRAEFARGPGGFVRGWPSKGGLYVLAHCFGVELDFLGLDRFNNTPRPSISDPAAAAEEEEIHCNKMRQLGATWYRNEQQFMRSVIEPESEDQVVTVGWPAGGGAWVLTESPARSRIKGTAIIHNAFNMEERCRAIEKLGGVFYKNPKDCRFLDLS
ncbi:hypothetical protein GGI35DRAFT_184605 [Trichoderma velutinum]